MVGKIRAFVIFEMLGRPPEHLKETLGQFVEKLGKEKNVKVLSKKINEVKRVEQAKQEIYTTFAETELQFKDIASLIKLVFVYMPSHIEITGPEELKMKNFEVNELVNELVRKLHQYDEIAKRLSVERNILYNRLQQLGVNPGEPVPQNKIKSQGGREKPKAKPKKRQKRKKKD